MNSVRHSEDLCQVLPFDPELQVVRDSYLHQEAYRRNGLGSPKLDGLIELWKESDRPVTVRIQEFPL